MQTARHEEEWAVQPSWVYHRVATLASHHRTQIINKRLQVLSSVLAIRSHLPFQTLKRGFGVLGGTVTMISRLTLNEVSELLLDAVN